MLEVADAGPHIMKSSIARVVLATYILCGLLAGSADAMVERYKTEAAYLARLTELGMDTLTDGFESSAWGGARSPTINDRSMLPSVLSQNVLWEPAAKDIWGSQYSNRQHGLTTNHNWARTGLWGLYEDHSGEPYPTTIRVSTTVPIFGVGGWFNTNPDGQSVGFLFEGRTTTNDPGYYLPGFGAMYPGDNPSFGHEFIGIVDPDGFTSVVLTGSLEVNEEGVLEGGTIFGADDFTFGVPAGFIPPVTGDLDGDGFVGITDLNTVLGSWNQSTPPADVAADPSGDNFVGIEDLNIVLGNWNTGTPPTGEAPANVPEPVSLACLGIVSASLLCRRRKRRRPRRLTSHT